MLCIVAHRHGILGAGVGHDVLACVGRTWLATAPSIQTRDLPRVRGKNWMRSSCRSMKRGSSSRAWEEHFLTSESIATNHDFLTTQHDKEQPITQLL